MKIDCAFPGGNIVAERVDENAAWVHQDLRDTESDWFYWCFRVTEAAGKTVRFYFTQSVAIGARGPAVSLDGGRTWRWLGADSVEGNGFTYAFPADANDVRFGMTVPYTGSDWEAFLGRLGDSPCLEKGTLCTSRQGRPVELLRLGCLKNVPEFRVLLTARHHCCETMASFVLEGLVAFILEDTGEGAWLRAHGEFLVVPFVDKDGVEAGDQGKDRKPRDHNRDYGNPSLYPETAALKALVPKWSEGRLRWAADIHCPWLRGRNNEAIYVVGDPNPSVWEEQERFSAILSRVAAGPLPYVAEDNIPFGTEWNTTAGFAKGVSFARWIAGLEEHPLPCTVEVPYANARGAEVNADSARRFGADLGRAVAAYLREAK